jgi:NAD(P)-dependent dehydrogenase (short-subunit alcohol dehydrogenase family)
MKTCKAMSMDDLESMFRTNVFGFYEMCRHFVSPKISEKGSSILGMSSIACLKRESGTSAYSMTKAAVNAMVYSLSAEFMKRQIRINALLPGIVRSKMGEDIDDRTDEEFERIAATQPLGAIPVEEIADMIVYMMSDRSAHMTGELITMSGGYR